MTAQLASHEAPALSQRSALKGLKSQPPSSRTVVIQVDANQHRHAGPRHGAPPADDDRCGSSTLRSRSARPSPTHDSTARRGRDTTPRPPAEPTSTSQLAIDTDNRTRNKQPPAINNARPATACSCACSCRRSLLRRPARITPRAALESECAALRAPYGEAGTARTRGASARRAARRMSGRQAGRPRISDWLTAPYNHTGEVRWRSTAAVAAAAAAAAALAAAALAAAAAAAAEALRARGSRLQEEAQHWQQEQEQQQPLLTWRAGPARRAAAAGAPLAQDAAW